MHFYHNKPYPYSTFLSWPSDYHTDYTRIVDAGKSHDPYHYYIQAFHGVHNDEYTYLHGGEVGNYLPFVYVVASVFSSRHGGVLIFEGLFLAGLAWYLLHQSGIRTDPQISKLAKTRIVLVLALMTYPVLWELDRSNFEGLTFLLMAAGAALIGRGKYNWAAVPLALAIAMKGYPAIFLGLYLPVRRYREAVAAGALSVIVCLVCFAGMQGGILQNILALKANLYFFLDYYVFSGAGAAGARMNCSPFALLGLLNSNPAFIKHALTYYNAFTLVAGAFVFWLVAVRKMQRWKLEYLLAAAGILLAPISYDYKLLVLFIPLASFLSSARREPRDTFYCASFGAMLIPKDYLFLGNHISVSYGVSISSFLEPLILTVTTVLIIREVLSGNASTEVSEINPKKNEALKKSEALKEDKETTHGDPGPFGHNPLVS